MLVNMCFDDTDEFRKAFDYPATQNQQTGIESIHDACNPGCQIHTSFFDQAASKRIARAKRLAKDASVDLINRTRQANEQLPSCRIGAHRFPGALGHRPSAGVGLEAAAIRTATLPAAGEQGEVSKFTR